MKQAIFLIVTYGIDGRDKEEIVFATTDEGQRDTVLSNSVNHAWYSTKDIVADLSEIMAATKKKLNGLECLSLSIKKIPTQIQ